MRFACRGLFALYLALLLMGLGIRWSAAESAPASNPAPTAVAQPASAQAYNLPPDKMAKAIALSRIRNILDIAGSLWGIAVLWLLLATRGAAGLEDWAQRISGRRWIHGVLFFAAFLVITTLASLPLDWIGHYYSRAYGISVQGWGNWFGDQAKALGLTILFGTLVLLLFNWIVQRWPRRYWFAIWLVTIPILLLVLFAEPVVIEPLFDKFEPLSQSNPALVQELEKVVVRTGTDIPPERMYLMKASLKTNGLNAYVSGIGATKRIVVWDTTAGRIPDDEVLFIFGHESGHYVLHHIWKGFAGTVIALFFIYWACAALAKWLVDRFGVRWRIFRPEMFAEPQPLLATRAGFVVLLFAISIAGFVLEPAGNAFSRHFEHQADVYGQEAIHRIVADPQKTTVAAFNDLGEAWLEDPNPNPFIEFWLYNHPSVQTRANFALHYDPWASGGHGEFFKN
jgi:Zn-dependent protease with chaperone function